jgi:hypothetical protein
MSAIEVIAVRRGGSGAIRAFVDIRLGGVTIKGCKVVEQPGKEPWLAMPSYKADRGWLQPVELSKELSKRVTPVAIAAWRNQAAADSATWSQQQRDEYQAQLAEKFQPDEEIPF